MEGANAPETGVQYIPYLDVVGYLIRKTNEKECDGMRTTLPRKRPVVLTQLTTVRSCVYHVTKKPRATAVNVTLGLVKTRRIFGSFLVLY